VLDEKGGEWQGNNKRNTMDNGVFNDHVTFDSDDKLMRDPSENWNDGGGDAWKEGDDSFFFDELSIPRRPAWDATTTPEELDKRERVSFLNWRRNIAMKEEQGMLADKVTEEDLQSGRSGMGGTKTNTSVTPFEKNIEVWRQLWRVLEVSLVRSEAKRTNHSLPTPNPLIPNPNLAQRSGAICQIVDGRNPLFYLSKDLTKYATEELGKPILVVVNKSDFLTRAQREIWSTELEKRGVEHIFFSAFDEQAKLDEKVISNEKAKLAKLEENMVSVDDRLENFYGSDDSDTDTDSPDDDDNDDTTNTPPPPPQQELSYATDTDTRDLDPADPLGVKNLLNRHQLQSALDAFALRHNIKKDPRYSDRIQFGMVGFPNVGKSSVINVLVGSSKHAHGFVRVAVAAQPGKTKVSKFNVG